METSIISSELSDGSEVFDVIFIDGSQKVVINAEDEAGAIAIQEALAQYATGGQVDVATLAEVTARAMTTKQTQQHSPEPLDLAQFEGRTLHGYEPALLAECKRLRDMYEAQELVTRNTQALYEHSKNQFVALRDREQGLRNALQAICARMDGVFDHPALVAFGPLRENSTDDVRSIVGAALK